MLLRCSGRRPGEWLEIRFVSCGRALVAGVKQTRANGVAITLGRVAKAFLGAGVLR